MNWITIITVCYVICLVYSEWYMQKKLDGKYVKGRGIAVRKLTTILFCWVYAPYIVILKLQNRFKIISYKVKTQMEWVKTGGSPKDTYYYIAKFLLFFRKP